MTLELPDFTRARLLIAGDVMSDRYWHGKTHRISPEAPVPIVQVGETEERPGGAGNVALNTAVLGCQTTLLAVTGADDVGLQLEHQLTQSDINCLFQRIPAQNTITKLRVISLHQQLIRLDFENNHYTPDTPLLLAKFEAALQHANVVILSDYAKGTLQNIPAFIQLAQAANVPVLIDPKGNDFTHYRGATLLTPNFKEFEAVVGLCQNDDDITQKALALIQQLDLRALLITRGEQGMTLVCPDTPALHLPARTQEVYDVTGAGDTVIAILAASLAAGSNLPTAVTIANIAAGLSVSKLGAASISLPELRRALLTEQQTSTRGVLSETQLLVAIEEAKAQGERIVMTGGCFDILHAGHVSYLEEAKRRGDRLIVVVNTDESVRHLKGPTRPINPLAERMSVLAGLRAVDWVTSFSESTPERIVGSLKPDLWVKAGDYHVDDLPEGRIVQSYGGEVEILGFVAGCSTTAIIQKAKEKQTEDIS